MAVFLLGVLVGIVVGAAVTVVILALTRAAAAGDSAYGLRGEDHVA